MQNNYIVEIAKLYSEAFWPNPIVPYVDDLLRGLRPLPDFVTFSLNACVR